MVQGFRPAGRSLHSLLLFSSFRFALDEFTAVGLAAPSLLPNPIPEVEESSCTWVEWDDAEPSPSPSTTSARVQHGTKRTIVIPEGESPYAVVVIKCLFADPAGSNGYGGHLFINSTAEEHVPVFSERPESVNKIQFEGPLQHRFAVCTPPIWKPVNAQALKEWLMYHHHLLGRDRIHYFFYTGIPLDDATVQLLQVLALIHLRANLNVSPIPCRDGDELTWKLALSLFVFGKCFDGVIHCCIRQMVMEIGLLGISL